MENATEEYSVLLQHYKDAVRQLDKVKQQLNETNNQLELCKEAKEVKFKYQSTEETLRNYSKDKELLDMKLLNKSNEILKLKEELKLLKKVVPNNEEILKLQEEKQHLMQKCAECVGMLDSLHTSYSNLERHMDLCLKEHSHVAKLLSMKEKELASKEALIQQLNDELHKVNCELRSVTHDPQQEIYKQRLKDLRKAIVNDSLHFVKQFEKFLIQDNAEPSKICEQHVCEDTLFKRFTVDNVKKHLEISQEIVEKLLKEFEALEECPFEDVKHEFTLLAKIINKDLNKQGTSKLCDLYQPLMEAKEEFSKSVKAGPHPPSSVVPEYKICQSGKI